MRSVNLLEDINDGSNGWNGIVLGLRTEFVSAALAKPVEGTDDLELLLGLAALLHQELLSFSTNSWPQSVISNTSDQKLLFRALYRVSRRNRLQLSQPEYRDYLEFKDYVQAKYGAKLDEAQVRSYLRSVFHPIEDHVHRIQDEIWDTELTQPISPHAATGWSKVDREILEMRDQFRAARSEQAHSSIGNSCNRILHFLSEAAFIPDRHLPAGEALPPVAKTKHRFDLIIERELAQSNQASLRKFARAAVELAEVVKHGSTPSRMDAGIAADGVIVLVNIMRRISEDARTRRQ
jgi:hypothetical protein